MQISHFLRKFVNNNYEVDFEVKFDKKKLLSFIREKDVISSVPKDTDVLFIPILIDTQNNEIKFFDQNYFYSNWNNVNKAIIKTLDEKPFLYGKEDYKNPSLLIKRSENLND